MFGVQKVVFVLPYFVSVSNISLIEEWVIF